MLSQMPFLNLYLLPLYVFGTSQADKQYMTLSRDHSTELLDITQDLWHLDHSSQPLFNLLDLSWHTLQNKPKLKEEAKTKSFLKSLLVCNPTWHALKDLLNS